MKKTYPYFLSIVALIATILTLNSCKKSTTTPDPVVALPTVTNVQPKNPSPGDVVTITGTGFGATATDVKVTIGSQVITISTVTDTQIKFTLPTGITAGDIAVAIKNIIATNTDPQKATITPQPSPVPLATITAINPTSGKVGDVVIITGTSFSATATDDVVKFNGVATTVTAATATTLTVSVPTAATTGTVTLSVKGAATITGPSFTVNTSGATGSPVSYIKVSGGTATFSKIATAPAEIGAMIVDKKNNILYYSDYTVFATAHTGTVYKLKLDGSAPIVLTTDTRINTVFNLGVDAMGNVIVFAGVDKQGVNVNVYKVDAGTGSVTGLATNVNLGGGNYPLVVDSQGAIWNGYGQKLNTTTNKFDRNTIFPYTSYTSTFYQGDDIYVDNGSGTDVSFVKYNLLTKSGTATDFTLQTLFKQDNAAIGSNSLDVQSRYALDNSENFYAIYPIAGDVASYYNDYYVIRKTKNGTAGANSLLLKFTTPFNVPAYIQPRSNIGLLFQADAAGNLYMKGNGTDIVKIVQ
ncbi:MAG: IPT/TIG domain-containing protein [Bacteroidota bacterium]